jgi:hypothetical protein
MLKQVLTLVALAPTVVFADSYLCVPEAGAVVNDGGAGGVEAGLLNVTPHKWVLSNESGNWVVKKLGSDKPYFDRCQSEFFCDNANGFGGAFWRDTNGSFGVVWMMLEGKINHLASAKGKCSKL